MSYLQQFPQSNDNDQVEIETPENIVLKYRIAGLGERLTAHVIDNLMMGLILFVILFLVGITAAGRITEDSGISELPDEEAAGAVAAVLMIIVGFSSFLYFGLQEWIMSGRTVGKRAANIRVVKANGFKLDFLSIFIRNIFRVIDHIPPFVFVPLFYSKRRRLGDYVAGTLVVMESITQLSKLRTELLSIPLANRTFRFDQGSLKHLTKRDYEVIETILERIPALQPDRKAATLQTACQALAGRMELNMPHEASHEIFLRDLLQTEYHRQNRQLG